jgi:hypothetical protein
VRTESEGDWAEWAGSHGGGRTSLCSESPQIRKERVISVKVRYLCGPMSRGDVGFAVAVGRSVGGIIRYIHKSYYT